MIFTPSDRRRGSHIDRRRDGINGRAVAYAAVVSSPFERGIVTAFAWFVKLRLPIRLFPRLEDAESWLWQRHTEFVESGSRRPSSYACPA